jgi:hypothetical protein
LTASSATSGVVIAATEIAAIKRRLAFMMSSGESAGA